MTVRRREIRPSAPFGLGRRLGRRCEHLWRQAGTNLLSSVKQVAPFQSGDLAHIQTGATIVLLRGNNELLFVDLGKAFSPKFMRRSADRSSSPLPFGEGTTSNCPREKTMTTTTTTIKKLPTHELFDVQQREGQKAFWNRVGAAFENRDGSHSVLLYQPGLPEPKRLQLRRIDREKRPLPGMPAWEDDLLHDVVEQNILPADEDEEDGLQGVE